MVCTLGLVLESVQIVSGAWDETWCITRQKQAMEGSVGIHLYLEDAVHHCGEDMGSQSVRELITCVCSREAESEMNAVCSFSPFY